MINDRVCRGVLALSIVVLYDTRTIRSITIDEREREREVNSTRATRYNNTLLRTLGERDNRPRPVGHYVRSVRARNGRICLFAKTRTQ